MAPPAPEEARASGAERSLASGILEISAAPGNLRLGPGEAAHLS